MTQHALWANSRAMQMAGLVQGCADIPGGVIEREADGTPSGIVAETASAPLRALVQRSPDQMARAARYFVSYFNRMGITAFKEPMAVEADLMAYRGIEEAGGLSLHMAAHLVRSSPMSPEPVPYDTIERWRRDYGGGAIRLDFAKLFLDGVAPSHSASFTEPYLAESGYYASSHDPDATLLIARDALNAVAEMSPKLWYPNPATAAQVAVLGRDRVERAHRLGDLLRAGAEVIYGSDWPAAAPDANPWPGMAGMLSRADCTGRFAGALGRDQAITLAQALPIFTRNGARSLGMGDETGTLEPGKWADFIVLDADPFTMSPEALGAVEVAETHWKGG